MKNFWKLAIILMFTIAFSTNIYAEQQSVTSAETQKEEIVLQVDKKELSGGGKITITGKAPQGKMFILKYGLKKT